LKDGPPLKVAHFAQGIPKSSNGPITVIGRGVDLIPAVKKDRSAWGSNGFGNG
jgi:hypothetical protein